MKTIDIFQYPRFTTAYENAYTTWCEDMILAGFKSAKLCSGQSYFVGRSYYLSDEDYTWFLLKWS